jgi:uncharacterized protein (TIGR02271 family)
MALPHDPPPGRDDAVDVTDLILSEEHLLVTTERRAVERVVLQKVIVTERRTITIDVSHEEIRLTREPVDEGTVIQAGARPAPREPVVMILHEEQITVSRTVVPVERVILTTTSVPEALVVEGTIRHEEIDVDVSPWGPVTTHSARREAT